KIQRAPRGSGLIIRGQKFRTMSALAPKADIGWRCSNVRFVPIADMLAICRLTGSGAVAREL
ncbi:MAG: hypothetical protein WA723_11180, partial [Pseudolabrys sp.]